ncbi:MAG: AAA family ATPase [Fibrobacterota bacterium]|nr:AAA family ATPase [Fibrobacterota bacterium]
MRASTPSSNEYHEGESEVISTAPRKVPSISSLFHILWLRKWFALTAWLLAAIPVGTILSVYDLPKTYTATTVIRFPEVIGAQTNVMRDVAITQGQSIISILNSHQVREGTIRKLGLRMRIYTPELFHKDVFRELQYGEGLGTGDYTITLEKNGSHATVLYVPPEGSSGYKIHSGPIQPEGRLTMPGLDIQFTQDFLAGSRGNRVDLSFNPLDGTFQEMKKSLTARPLGGGNFELKMKDRDPWLVADILNALRAQFLEVYYGTTEVQDVGILVQMEKDLEASKERLEKSQDELSRYYSAHPELVAQQGPTQGENMAYLESRQQIDIIQQHKKRVQQAFAAKEQGASPEKNYYWAMELLSTMAEAGEAKANIQRLSLQEVNTRQINHQRTLGPEHPKIKEAETEKEALYGQIEEAKNSLVRRMDQELGDLKLRLASNTPKGASRPPVKVQLELERLNNVNQNNEKIYDRLLESYNRAKLVTGSEFFKVSVVDPARPAIYEPPSIQARLLIAATAVLMLLFVVPGLVLAWSLVFIRIWTKDDVGRLLNIKCLGVLVLRKMKRDKKSWKKQSESRVDQADGVDPMLIIYGGNSQLEDVEAFRIIREEIENAFRNPAAAGKYCIMITSSRPHEGKSTCAANLAVTFARKGKRTLLVDADFRLGRTAKIFNLKVSTGIDTILDQTDINAEQFLESATLVFQHTMQRNLVIAPCKSPNANASELVSSDRFKAFIRMARDQFDVVIIDTPPVMITPEPLSLAELTDGVVFLCRSGLTVASEAREAVENLKERNTKIAAILNCAKTSPFEQSRYKKYSYYYQVQPAPDAQAG